MVAKLVITLTYHASRAEAADRPDDWHTDAYFTVVRQGTCRTGGTVGHGTPRPE